MENNMEVKGRGGASVRGIFCEFESLKLLMELLYFDREKC